MATSTPYGGGTWRARTARTTTGRPRSGATASRWRPDPRGMPGPAPPIVDGLQINQALDFQRRFGRVQRVAWWLLSLVPVAAVAGLFGGRAVQRDDCRRRPHRAHRDV